MTDLANANPEIRKLESDCFSVEFSANETTNDVHMEMASLLFAAADFIASHPEYVVASIDFHIDLENLTLTIFFENETIPLD